jgi:hypothetical protein
VAELVPDEVTDEVPVAVAVVEAEVVPDEVAVVLNVEVAVDDSLVVAVLVTVL